MMSQPVYIIGKSSLGSLGVEDHTRNGNYDSGDQLVVLTSDGQTSFDPSTIQAACLEFGIRRLLSYGTSLKALSDYVSELKTGPRNGSQAALSVYNAAVHKKAAEARIEPDEKQIDQMSKRAIQTIYKYALDYAISTAEGYPNKVEAAMSNLQIAASKAGITIDSATLAKISKLRANHAYQLGSTSLGIISVQDTSKDGIYQNGEPIKINGQTIYDSSKIRKLLSELGISKMPPGVKLNSLQQYCDAFLEAVNRLKSLKENDPDGRNQNDLRTHLSNAQKFAAEAGITMDPARLKELNDALGS